MSCGCSSKLKDGMSIVDHVTSKGKANFETKEPLFISCECGESFTMTKVIMNCPNCEMTYAVTPCSSDDVNNVKPAGIKYAQ